MSEIKKLTGGLRSMVYKILDEAPWDPEHGLDIAETADSIAKAVFELVHLAITMRPVPRTLGRMQMVSTREAPVVFVEEKTVSQMLSVLGLCKKAGYSGPEFDALHDQLARLDPTIMPREIPVGDVSPFMSTVWNTPKGTP